MPGSTRSSSSRAKLQKPNPRHRSVQESHQAIGSVRWLFRSSVTTKRSSYITPDIRKRSFFGMGEILGVISNPAETVRSLTESKRLLEEARREINEGRERSQLKTKHTFSRLPGFFARKEEIKTLQRALGGEPSFTVLFGASSTGKTALLREVLSRDDYHVLHFDLRIAGFADIYSLYMSLSQQIEQYWEVIAESMDGYQQFEKEAWAFKHDRLSVERRLADANDGRPVTTSDVARLMELFQSSLLRYWQFQPTPECLAAANARKHHHFPSTSTDTVNSAKTEKASHPKHTWSFRRPHLRKQEGEQATLTLEDKGPAQEAKEAKEAKEELKPPAKRMPVIFFDEAHKLPALVQSSQAMKCLLDSMLVLTKQDRLCHVIHATSDPFYQTWLRQLNIMQHCKIITIGDCSREETKRFYLDELLPRIPDHLKVRLDFEALYEAFGGKLAHWQDYITDYINSNGRRSVRTSSHFVQAHALLNLHIIHSSQPGSKRDSGRRRSTYSNGGGRKKGSTQSAETLHPGLGPASFKIYSPITNPSPVSSQADSSNAAHEETPEFNAMQLLNVMSRLTAPGVEYLSYFALCREIGVRAVDGMVKGRVLDLRWTEVVEGAHLTNGLATRPVSTFQRQASQSDTVAATLDAPPTLDARPSQQSELRAPAPGIATAGSHRPGDSTAAFSPISMDGDIEAMSEGEQEYYLRRQHQEEDADDDFEFVGPKLVPITPIMRFAMGEVVAEYEDVGTESEYASLSDVSEY
ncbi:hypothetical protein CYLTODRAFT_435963 [Cylindrobasidium torrendii FP15055 ss-10]|uniref:AAA+ ATPase domain-containing protein n=1 Tax=Cylindrobasidium torrendii FP15055 ss-10 TaxID=1314674 RepID=A0A0D7BGU5_9AGAR|nr:hypothetical protein CYLTODRAFT_435963 [Cylindrobasidium torrendii FP15055 ss-10]